MYVLWLITELLPPGIIASLLIITAATSINKFIFKKPAQHDQDSSDSDTELQQSPEKVAARSKVGTIRKKTNKMREYKTNLSYNEAWKKKHPWMAYDSSKKGMVCTVCKIFGKIPVQARGAWVTWPVDNWMKAATLLRKCEKSEWHLAAVEKRALNQSAQEHGDVVDIIVTAGEEERKQNRELMKKLI